MQALLLIIASLQFIQSSGGKGKIKKNSQINKQDYYFDTSKEYDLKKDDANALLVMNQKKIQGTKYDQNNHNLVSQAKISQRSTELEQPYYDPTMNPIGEVERKGDYKNVMVVPVKALSNLDYLKQQALNVKNKNVRGMLFKKDNTLVNQIYYDSSVNPPQLAVEDLIQKNLRQKQEEDKQKKKTITYDEYLGQMQDLEQKHDLLLNRQNIYQNELPDQRIQRKDENRQFLEQFPIEQ